MKIKEGRVAPDFSLENARGEKVRLKDYRGKNVIVYFYPRDDTPGCTKEAQGFRDLYRKFRSRNVVILGVSPDDGTSHRRFIEKHDLPFELLSDPRRKVMTEYGAYGEKMLYGRKTVGVIRSTVWVDPAGRVKKHWARVPKAADHPEKILDALASGGDED